ncbi:uncharacterized protein PV09_09865, partial [Verruconis gallopava]
HVRHDLHQKLGPSHIVTDVFHELFATKYALVLLEGGLQLSLEIFRKSTLIL